MTRFPVQMVGAIMWIVYGVLIDALPVIAANVLVFFAAAWATVRGRLSAPRSDVRQSA